MVSTLPPLLIVKKENKLVEDYKIETINYDKIYPETSQKVNKIQLLSPDKLPIRLYNVDKLELTKNNVEETKNNANIQNYAILSYV
jgi:hypothetical protein